MNLIDTLDLYAMLNDSDEMFLMLQDYTLDSRIDRNTLNTVIIKDLGAVRPITTDCTMFKLLLEAFFNKYSYNITKLVDTMYLEYSPLNTKDIDHTLTETENRHSVGDIDNTDTYTTNTDSSDTASKTDTNTVSAYDSSSYQPKEQVTSDSSSTVDTDVEHSGETTSDIESTVDTEKSLTENTSGKDGDTSYQSLLEQERKASEFNIFNWIIQRMREELFLLVY